MDRAPGAQAIITRLTDEHTCVSVPFVTRPRRSSAIGITQLTCAKEPIVKSLQKASAALPRATRPAQVLALLAVGIGIAVGAQFTKSAAGATCPPSAEVMGRLEMLFGTARRHGPAISDEEWASFLDAEVTPRFPGGFTVLCGPGQWRGSDGAVAKEQSNKRVHSQGLES